MDIASVTDLGAVIIAIAALALSAYTTRAAMRHQREMAHEARLWEYRVQTMLDLLDWLDVEGARLVPPAGSATSKDQTPLFDNRLHSRLKAFFPASLMDEVVRALMRVGQWRRAADQAKAGDISMEDFFRVESSARQELAYVRHLVTSQVTAPPHLANRVHHMLVKHHKGADERRERRREQRSRR